jgi:hypothetical protein
MRARFNKGRTLDGSHDGGAFAGRPLAKNSCFEGSRAKRAMVEGVGRMESAFEAVKWQPTEHVEEPDG